MLIPAISMSTHLKDRDQVLEGEEVMTASWCVRHLESLPDCGVDLDGSLQEPLITLPLVTVGVSLQQGLQLLRGYHLQASLAGRGQVDDCKVSPKPRAEHSVGGMSQAGKEDKVLHHTPLVAPLQTVQATAVHQLSQVVVGRALPVGGVVMGVAL